VLFAVRQASARPSSPSSSRRYLFGDADRLVRIDMSELTTPGAIARLITPSPPARASPIGFAASRSRSCCSTRSKRPPTPRSISSFGVLARVRLTDAFGRLVDFRMSLIVMTTNLGAADPRPAGFSSDPDSAPDPSGAIRNFFRPELLGRLDAIVPFRPLPPAALEKIVELEIDKLRNRPGFIARKTCASSSPSPPARASPSSATISEARRPARSAARSKTWSSHRSPNDGEKKPWWRDATSNRNGR